MIWDGLTILISNFYNGSEELKSLQEWKERCSFAKREESKSTGKNVKGCMFQIIALTLL